MQAEIHTSCFLLLELIARRAHERRQAAKPEAAQATLPMKLPDYANKGSHL
jgi:hypothetical protein